MPAAVLAAAGAYLGDDAQGRRVRVQRLPDELVDHEGPVEVAGVDVRDAQIDGLAQYRDRPGAVLRRTADPGAGQLHGAEAHAADDQILGKLDDTARRAGSHVSIPSRVAAVGGSSAADPRVQSCGLSPQPNSISNV